MRISLLAALVVLLLSPCNLVHADEAKAIIEKAIEAHGGAAKLDKLKTVMAKAKAAVADSGASVSRETFWQWPDRLKNVVVTRDKDKTSTRVETIDGDDDWSSHDGWTGALGVVKRDELRTRAYVRRLLLLKPLLDENIYELSALKPIRIDDRPAVGVRVVCPGERDVKLYFDADSGRLAKIERFVHDEAAKKEVRHEDLFGDYRDRDGVPTAMKRVRRRDGKKILEMTISEVRYLDRFDAATFADPRPYRRQRDVIYGHKLGVALTMDVFTPKKGANGAAVVAVVSGGWFSDRAAIDSGYFRYLIDVPVQRGYTVFAVCHGSQPRFTIPDAIADVNRAVRYIRHHARDYRIDPRRIGVTGASAGGHLSLMLGVAGTDGDPQATDAVERTSSRVQAVGCFFPPTDFLNYGDNGKFAFAEDGVLADYRTAIDVREPDKKTKRLEHLADKDKIEALCRRLSPIAHVRADAAPTLILHGDADKLVPLQQAEAMVSALKKEKVPAKLIVKKDGGHLWPGMEKDMVAVVDWFDRYLLKK